MKTTVETCQRHNPNILYGSESGTPFISFSAGTKLSLLSCVEPDLEVVLL
jgi:hypothetical protein